jgi:hypothetical protein
MVNARYCPQCGERRLQAHDYSMRHHLRESLEILTHMDSKILRSLWQLVRRPGALSVDYLRGRRVAFLRPLRLFVFVNVAYFLSLTLVHAIHFPIAPGIQFNTFATPLETQLHGNDFYPGLAARAVAGKQQRMGLGYAELERRYDETTTVFSKTLVFLLIPFIAALFAILFFRKRRFLAEHLVVATHFWAFVLVLLGIILPVVVAPVIYLAGVAGLATTRILNDVTVTYALQLVLAAYIYFMLRKVYSASAWYSALLALSLAWSFFFVVWLFRFFLFGITLFVI